MEWKNEKMLMIIQLEVMNFKAENPRLRSYNATGDLRQSLRLGTEALEPDASHWAMEVLARCFCSLY